MEASDNCKASRNYSNWDASYGNCLCLLLCLTGLTLLIVLVTILIPGKTANVGPVHQVPENFDPILYEKLLAEYHLRNKMKPSTVTFAYAPFYTTSRVPIHASKGFFQSVKKMYRKPISSFTPRTTFISYETTTITPATEGVDKSVNPSYYPDRAGEEDTDHVEETTKRSTYIPIASEEDTDLVEEITQRSTYTSERSATESTAYDQFVVSETTQQISSTFLDIKNPLGNYILEENGTTSPASKSERLQNLPQQTNEDFEIAQDVTEKPVQFAGSGVQLLYPFSETPLNKDTTTPLNLKKFEKSPTIEQVRETSTSSLILEQQPADFVPQQGFKSEKLQELPEQKYEEQYFLRSQTSSSTLHSKIATYTSSSLEPTKIYTQMESNVTPSKNPEIVGIVQFLQQHPEIKTTQVPGGNLTSQIGQNVLNGNNIFEQRTIVKEKIIRIPCPEPPPVCSTKTCKRSAGEMLALIDHSSDPCDDFYWYACNGLEINRMDDRNSESILLEKIKDFTPDDPLQHEFKHLFDSCMDFSAEGNYFYVRKHIEDLVNDTKYNSLSEVDALTELMSNILALSPSGSNFRLLPFFDVTVDLDVSGSFIPTLTIPTEESLMVSSKSFDIYEEQCMRHCMVSHRHQKTVVDIYQAYIECSQNIAPYILNLNTTLYSLGVLDYLPKLNRSQKIIDIEQDVQFDVYEVLGAVTQRSRLQKLQSADASPFYMNLAELQSTYPQVNWTTLLSNLFQTRFSQIKIVRVLFKENLDQIFEFFQNTKFADIKNLIMAMLLHDLDMDVKIVEPKCMSENFCMKLSMRLMEDVAAKILLGKITKKDLSLLDEYTSDLVVRIRNKFRQYLESSEWLSNNQRKILLEKLEKIKVVSNALNLFFNDGVLAYRNANLKLGKNFAENLVKIRRNKRLLTYEKITNNPGSVWMYNYNPMETEVFTIAKSHQIIIPIGLLSKFAVKKRNYLREYEILAKLGFAISKALMSFFTPENLYAAIPDLKLNDELKNFVEIELADPPLTHFENVFDLAVTKEDIKLTMDDRFSDDGGLSLAYETFLNISNIRSDPLIWLNLTSSQLFYLSFAQNFCEHSKTNTQLAVEISENARLPPYFRVNSAIMNSSPFADQFGCRVGSSMNPEFKVKSFPRIEHFHVDYDKK